VIQPSLFYLNPALFKVDGVLTGGRYLPGIYSWPVDVRLQGARLSCVTPTDGTLALTLMVGGVSVPGAVFLVGGARGSGDVFVPTSFACDFRVTVPANMPVRWWVDFDGAAEDAARAVEVVVPVQTSAGWMTATTRTATLTVDWVNGSERFTLFSYDPPTRTFNSISVNPTLYGQVIQNARGTSFYIQGQLCLRVADEVTFSPMFTAVGGIAPNPVQGPRLQFCIDGVPVANVTQQGLWMVDGVEDTPVAGGEGFEFYGVGELIAVLTAQGMTGVSFQEI